MSSAGGTAITIATVVTHIVPAINGRKPNNPCSGLHTCPVNRSSSEARSSSGADRSARPAAISASRTTGSSASSHNERVARRSFM